MPASEKQMQFLNSLKGEVLGSVAGRLNEPMLANDEIESLVMRAAFVIALPEPASPREASAQIDALKGNGAGMRAYARQHQDWAISVAQAVADRLGEDVAQWRSRIERDPRFVTEYRPGGETARVQDGTEITPASLARTFA